MKKDLWLSVIFLITLILLGMHTVITKRFVTRDGIPIPEIQAVFIGIVVATAGIIGLIYYIKIIWHLERKIEKRKIVIKCPSCGKKKDISTAGKYKCSICNCKFFN